MAIFVYLNRGYLTVFRKCQRSISVYIQDWEIKLNQLKKQCIKRRLVKGGNTYGCVKVNG